MILCQTKLLHPLNPFYQVVVQLNQKCSWFLTRKDHLKFQSTIISKQLPLQSIKLINDSSVLIADVGNNSDRFDLKSMQTNDINWRKEIKLKKGKTILWRESILHFHQRLYILYIDETYRTVGLATIKE